MDLSKHNNWLNTDLKEEGSRKTASALRDEDFIKQVLVLNTHVQVLCFTTKGKVHWLEIYKLPVMSRTAKGRPISNVLPLEDESRSLHFCL